MHIPPVGMPDRTGTTVGPYAFLRRIGGGGMGEVWLGQDRHLRRDVALKVVRPDLLENATVRDRFLQEARIASSVVHPYVATVFDVVEKAGETILVMEYVEGRGLQQIIRDPSSTPLEERLRYGLEIAEALDAIHDRGLLHRDLKPSNVIVTPADHVKVLDFGLARRSRPAADATGSAASAEPATLSLTEPGVAVGTVAYMSPEQVRGQKLDRRSDLFSLGVVLCELATSQHPFLRPSIAQTVTAILEDEPFSAASGVEMETPVALQPVLSRALAKSREERYASAGELAADLRAILRGETAGAARREIRRRRIGLSVVVAAGIAVAAAIAAWAWLRTPPPWAAPRIALAFVPLEDRTGLDDGSVRASMVADLIATELSGSRIVRAIGPDQTRSVASGLPAGASGSEIARRVATALAVDYVVTGVLYKDGDRLVATIETHPARDGPSLAAFRADGATATIVAESLAASLRRALPGVSRVTALRDDQADVVALTSSSEEARMLYERGLLAWHDGKLSEATEFLDKAVAADPRFALARSALSQVRHEAGYGRLAREEADRALAAAPAGSAPAAERLRLTIETVRARVSEDAGAFEAASERLAARYGDEPELLQLHAEALDAAGRGPEAIGAADRALALDGTRPALQLTRATILAHAERWDDALAAVDAADRVYRMLGSREGEANAERLRGRTLFQAQRHAPAEAALVRATAQFRALGRESLAADTARDLASLHLLAGQPGKAEALLTEAARAARASGNLGLLCRILSSQGAQAYVQGNYANAEALIRDAADQARRLENDRLLLDPLSNLTSLLYYTGRYAEARTAVEELVQTATRSGSREHLLDARLNLANLDLMQGHLESSLDGYAEVLRQEGDAAITQNAAWSQLGRAEIHRAQGRLEDALAEANRGVEIFDRLEASGFAGYARLGRGQILTDLGRSTEARADFDRAEIEARRDETGLADLTIRVGLARSLLASEEGRLSDARRGASRAVRESAAMSPVLRASIEGARCEIELLAGEAARAEPLCRRASEDPAAQPTDAIPARAARAEALAKLGRPAEARDEARRVLEEAARAELRLPGARAAAVIAGLPEAERPEDVASIRERGRMLLDAYLAGAPAPDRDRLTRRTTIARLRNLLGAAPDEAPGNPVPPPGIVGG